MIMFYITILCSSEYYSKLINITKGYPLSTLFKKICEVCIIILILHAKESEVAFSPNYIYHIMHKSVKFIAECCRKNIGSFKGPSERVRSCPTKGII